MPGASRLSASGPRTTAAGGENGGPSARVPPGLAGAYGALIVFGSLFPLSGWHAPESPLFAFLAAGRPDHWERADILQNVLVYMPLGLLLTAWLGRSLRFGTALAIAILAGMALSLAMECLQQFLPGRVASWVDLATNGVGTAAGGSLAGFLREDTLSGSALLKVRDAWFRPGRLVDVGLVALGLWALSQTSPLVPSLDVSHLRQGLSLLRQTLRHPEFFQTGQAIVYGLEIFGLGLLALTIGRPGKPMVGAFLGFVSAVLLAKVMVVGRQLSLEALAGAGAAGCALAALRGPPIALAAWAGAASIGAGFAVAELAPGMGGAPHPFNWVPFLGQMNGIGGLENVLEAFWPPLAIAWFARCAAPADRWAVIAFSGGIAVPAAAFALEWHQQALPGRFGDITPALLALAAWIVPWGIRPESHRQAAALPAGR